MNIDNVDVCELIDRYKVLIVDYANLVPELAKKLEQFGRIRKELQLITDELVKRKINVEDLDKEIKKKDENKI